MQPEDASPKIFPQDGPCLRGKTNGDAGKPTPKTASRVRGGLRAPKTGAVFGSATGRPEDCRPSASAPLAARRRAGTPWELPTSLTRRALPPQNVPSTCIHRL